MFKPFMVCGTAVFHCKPQLIKKGGVHMRQKNNPHLREQQYGNNIHHTHPLSHIHSNLIQ